LIYYYAHSSGGPTAAGKDKTGTLLDTSARGNSGAGNHLHFVIWTVDDPAVLGRHEYQSISSAQDSAINYNLIGNMRCFTDEKITLLCLN